MFWKDNYITFSCSALLIYVFLLTGQGFIYKQRPPPKKKSNFGEVDKKFFGNRATIYTPSTVTKYPPLLLSAVGGCSLCVQDAHLSQRDRAAGCIIVFAKSRRLEVGDNIYRHYRPIFNHCKTIGLKIGRIWWKKGYYGVQGHSRLSRSVPIESPYAIS